VGVTEPDSSPKRLTNVAGVIGLATAVIGLVGTGLAVWGGSTPDKAEVQAIAGPAGEAAEDLTNVPAEMDGYMSGPAFAETWSRHTLCYDWRPKDETCQVTGRVTQRGARGLRATEMQYVLVPSPAYRPSDMIVVADMREQNRPVPAAYATVEEVDYRITRKGICTSNAEREAGSARIQVFAASIDGADPAPLSVSGLAAYRAELAQTYRTQAVGDRQCWRYRLQRGTPDQVVQDYFIDDVLQAEQSLTFSLIPSDQAVYLHIPAA
jgi:hypothetical protein